MSLRDQLFGAALRRTIVERYGLMEGYSCMRQIIPVVILAWRYAQMPASMFDARWYCTSNDEM